MSFKKFLSLIKSGKIIDPPSIIACLIYAKKNNKIGTIINATVIISLILEYLTEISEKIIDNVPIINKTILNLL